MYPANNEGKSVGAERFIRTLIVRSTGKCVYQSTRWESWQMQ